MPRPPSYQKVNPADQPILFLSLSSDTLPLYTVDEYAETLMAQRISMVSGVSRVQVFGAQKYAVRVQVDPGRSWRRAASASTKCSRPSSSSNTNLPTGKLYGAKQAFTVQSSGQLMNAAAYRPMIVAYATAIRCAWSSSATCSTAWRTTRSAAWFNDDRSIILAIQRQPGTNTVEVVDNVRSCCR